MTEFKLFEDEPPISDKERFFELLTSIRDELNEINRNLEAIDAKISSLGDEVAGVSVTLKEEL